MEFTIPVLCKLLHSGSIVDTQFEDVTADVNVQEDTAFSLKEKLDTTGFVIYFGEILKDTDRFKTFFDGREQLVVMACPHGWRESEEEAQNSNSAERLVNAGFDVTHVLKALGRAVWHEGFEPFYKSAHLIKHLIDEGSLENYQNRTETITVNDHSELKYVSVFNEFTSELHLPVDGPDGADDEPISFVEAGCVFDNSQRHPQDCKKYGKTVRQIMDHNKVFFEVTSKAVVRMFGYHPLQPASGLELGTLDYSLPGHTVQRGTPGTPPSQSLPHKPDTPTQAAVGSTAITEQPTKLDVSDINATTSFSAISLSHVSDQLAHHKETHETTTQSEDTTSSRRHTSHTQPTKKTWRVTPFTGFFVAPSLILATKSCNYSKEHNTYADHFKFTRNRRATHSFLRDGVDLIECTPVYGITSYLVDRIRHIGVIVPNDIIPPEAMATRWSDILLFEVADKHKSDVFLLPEIHPIYRDDILFSTAYHSRPTLEWTKETFGENSDTKNSTQMSADFSGQLPCFNDQQMGDHFWKYDIVCVGPGEAKDDEMDGIVNHMCCLLGGSRGSPIFSNFEARPFYTFSAINCGRSRTDILSAEGPGGVQPCRRHNCGITTHNLAFVLVYQHYIAPLLTTQDTSIVQHIKQFLQPYKILTEKERLQSCHVKMLRDADDFNEYGMLFYDGNKLQLALHCFREGARMFSIANIPGQTEYDSKLKDALQSNVSNVIMRLKDAGQIAE